MINHHWDMIKAPSVYHYRARAMVNQLVHQHGLSPLMIIHRWNHGTTMDTAETMNSILQIRVIHKLKTPRHHLTSVIHVVHHFLCHSPTLRIPNLVRIPVTPTPTLDDLLLIQTVDVVLIHIMGQVSHISQTDHYATLQRLINPSRIRMLHQGHDPHMMFIHQRVVPSLLYHSVHHMAVHHMAVIHMAHPLILIAIEVLLPVTDILSRHHLDIPVHHLDILVLVHLDHLVILDLLVLLVILDLKAHLDLLDHAVLLVMEIQDPQVHQDLLAHPVVHHLPTRLHDLNPLP